MIQVTKNKNGVSNTIFCVSVGVLIVVCAVFGFVAFVQNPSIQEANSQLQADYEELQIDHDNVVANYQDLQSSYNNLQNDWDQMEAELYNLQSSFDQLNATYYELLESIGSGSENVTE